jgi:hypothetical protein
MNANPKKDFNGEIEYSSAEFTPEERRRMRKMLEADRFRRQFWTTLRVYILWIGGVAVAITAAYQWIRDAVKFMAR